ncbi:unnamed protein product [Ectocarpus sp. 4 AP-2014]
MSSWYTPERYAAWPGSSPPERNATQLYGKHFSGSTYFWGDWV